MDRKQYSKKNLNIYFPTTLPYFWTIFHLDIFFFLVKSLKKFDRLDGGCSFPFVYLAMAQIPQKGITVTVNNTCWYNSDIYLYLSLSFFSVSPSYEPSLFLFLIINFLLYWTHSDEVSEIKTKYHFLIRCQRSSLSNFPLLFLFSSDLTNLPFIHIYSLYILGVCIIFANPVIFKTDFAANDSNLRTHSPPSKLRKLLKFSTSLIAEAKNVIYLLNCTLCQKQYIIV